MTEQSGASGDDKKLAALVARLSSLASGTFRRDLVAKTADVARQQLAREFASATDPNGNAWTPTVAGGAPLVGSGRLRGSVTVSQSSDGYTVQANAPYAGVHQRGAVIRAKRGRLLRFRLPSGEFISKPLVVIPKRPFLPTGALRGPWRDALREAATLAVSRAMKI